MDTKKPDSPLEATLMTVVMARLLSDARNVFHGLASPLPAVAIALAKKVHNSEMTYLNIAGGVDIDAAGLSISTCSPGFLEGSTSFFSLSDIFDLSARGELDTAFLGGVQIDSCGRINNSVIGPFSQPKVKLPGGAGSAAIVPTARRTIVWRTRHDTRTMVEKCDFVTAAGNVSHVITPMGVLARIEGTLQLAGWFHTTSPEEIQRATGFDLSHTPDCAVIAEPSDVEISELERLDPKGVRFSEFHG